jgi:hypothetical protein
MAYGLDPRLFLENGPANQAALVHARSSSDAYRAWSRLNSERRLGRWHRRSRYLSTEQTLAFRKERFPRVCGEPVSVGRASRNVQRCYGSV